MFTLGALTAVVKLTYNLFLLLLLVTYLVLGLLWPQSFNHVVFAFTASVNNDFLFLYYSISVTYAPFVLNCFLIDDLLFAMASVTKRLFFLIAQ
jgi:hypothetical protein